MGCCSSRDRTCGRNPGNYSSHVKLPESRAPPPPVEEETVKEVLSETPMLKPAVSRIKKHKKTDEPAFPCIEKEMIMRNNPLDATRDISENSQICCSSESISTSNVTNMRGNDHDRSRDGRDRSLAKVPRKNSVSGEDAGRTATARGGKSPARGSGISPGKMNDNARNLLYGREVSQTQTTGRCISGTKELQRDPGKASRLRSTPSAATATATGAQLSTVDNHSPSTGKSGRSPGRIPAEVTERSREVEENKEENWPRWKESLENPLVAFECFIFL